MFDCMISWMIFQQKKLILITLGDMVLGTKLCNHDLVWCCGPRWWWNRCSPRWVLKSAVAWKSGEGRQVRIMRHLGIELCMWHIDPWVNLIQPREEHRVQRSTQTKVARCMDTIIVIVVRASWLQLWSMMKDFQLILLCEMCWDWGSCNTTPSWNLKAKGSKPIKMLQVLHLWCLLPRIWFRLEKAQSMHQSTCCANVEVNTLTT